MRSEIERLMGQVVRCGLRPNTTNPFAGRFSDRQVKILPSFNGEMGYEIIFFLSRIEPYLRNGWRILARRPALYPPGTAFYDAAYFAELDRLAETYNVIPTPAGLRQRMQRAGQYLDATILQGNLEKIEVKVRYDSPQVLIQESQFELQLRDLFYSYCDLDKRGVLDIDTMLLSCQPTRLHDYTTVTRPVLRPSYQPQAFLAPTEPQRPHIGVQLRAMTGIRKQPEGKPGRDSDAAFVLPLAARAAAHLGLPIVVYGRPDGNLLPDGYERTYELGIDLLDKELRLLPACRLMFAPDSGWADLMAWLQVPTLLEGSLTPGHFDELIDFSPRIALIDRSLAIEGQIDALLAADVCTPNDRPVLPSLENEVHTKAFLGL